MNSNFSSVLFRPLTLAVLLLWAAAPVWAQQPVGVQAKIKGDLLHIEALTRGPEPTLRMNPSPMFLELTFPKGALEGAPIKRTIDKGLVQKIVTTQTDKGVLTRIYVVSKPKASLIKTATGYRYTINVQEMASAPNRAIAKPKKPAATASKPAATASKPAATASKPATKPATRVVSKPATGPQKPVATKPNKPATTTKPVTTKPVKPTATTPSKPAAAIAQPGARVREYYPYQKKRSATKAMEAAKLAFPNISYMMDPMLNVLLVEGSASDIEQLEKFLRAQSKK